MEKQEASLKCPYCKKLFAPSEILFYTNLVQKSYFTALGVKEKEDKVNEVGQTRQKTVINKVGAVPAAGLAKKDTVTVNEETPKQKEEVKIPLGVQTDDTVAEETMKKYGGGKDFNFKRTATFYGIKNEEEIVNGEKGYGFVCTYEEGENVRVPKLLVIKNEDGSQSRITQRVCPQCHCDIPNGYFACKKENIHEVALAGCTAAGKTQYMTVALRELLTQFEQTLHLGSISLTDCSKWFYDMFVSMFVKLRGMPSTEMKELFPFILRVKGTNSEDEHFVIFNDCAGEYAADSADAKKYAVNLKSFQNAETLLLMIDCSQFFPDDVVLGEGEKPCTMPYKKALAPLTEYALLGNLKEVLIVLTKCDGIFDKDEYIHGQQSADVNDGMEMVSTDMTAHKDAVDTGLINRVESELLVILEKHGEKDIKRNISRDISKPIKILGVSTYIKSMDPTKKRLILTNDPTQQVGHFRLTEPLLYMFFRMGIVPGEEKPQQVSEPEPLPRKVGLFSRIFGRNND